MNASAARRCEVAALISVWCRRIFRDRELIGRIHPRDGGDWLAEDFSGRALGVFHEERLAAHAVDAAARRRS
jgi:hypothetical protein